MTELKYNLTVNLALENDKCVIVPCTSTTTAEDVCISICKQLNITTIARHLFALRITGKQVFLMPSATFDCKSMNFDFRMRFKVTKVTKLKNIDMVAYNYFFQQARTDVLDNKIPDLVYEKYRRELVGLGITDMYRVMLEKQISRETVESDYKKYIPKEVLKRHAFFIRKPIHDNLAKLQKTVRDAPYVMTEYVKQLDVIAPEYLHELYKAKTDPDGTRTINILVKVSPVSGLTYSCQSKKDEWHTICTIEELGFISIRNDSTVEISRKTGIPFYLKFDSNDITYSFISVLDGYYRLTCKWTFNVCKEVPTPSLKKLQAMKCHGPVGGEFSYAKLEEKRNNHTGCFILRESETNYNTYYIDVCVKDSIKPKTFKMERITENEFIFNDDTTRYTSIPQLMKAYSDPNGAIFLKECLPPSEYDVSQVLLCKSDNLVGDSLADTSLLNELPSSPVCINCKDLQVYKGSKKEGSRGNTMMYKGMWKVTKGKKIEVAIKMLTQDSLERHLKDYLNLLGQWSFLQSSSIARLYGIAFINNIASVLEYFKLGPLDMYLQENKTVLKQEDLIEAASNLASALWHLKESNIVHGKIRCRKLMVYRHDEDSFMVKLTDPGIHTFYASSEVHWIPVECYTNLDNARKSPAADVWALATTLYEIFTYGAEFKTVDHVQTMRWYINGRRFQKPPKCPDEIYTLMLECWEVDPHKRKQPQEISRDVNQLLYQVYNSRKKHSYAIVTRKTNTPDSIQRNRLNTTEPELDLVPVNQYGDVDSISIFDNSQQYLLGHQDGDMTDASSISISISNFTFSTTVMDSQNSLNSLQSVFDLDDNCDVILQGKIGQGFYGEVYKGTLEYSGNQGIEPRRVAVKKLKSSTESSLCLRDFEREIDIMKTLKHPNIVEILGVLRNPEIALVMEFVQHGSLQSFLKINREKLQTMQLLKFALDIAKGMEYLGKKNIVHRDLAARNILVADENHVKISDFGLAQVTNVNDYYIMHTNRDMPIKWYAPESLENGKFSVKSDVWSYGVTMCEMFNYGEEPHFANVKDAAEGQEQQALLDAITRGDRIPCPTNCPHAVYIRIIYPCWEANLHERPSFHDLKLETEDLLTQY